MTAPLTNDLSAFRAETRAWLEANCPAEMRTPASGEADICWGGRKGQYSPAQMTWLTRMGERGWTVPTWPREYGGGGLDAEQAKVLAQEMKALGCRSPHSNFGIWMLGPALMKFGTHEQKLEHLPKIARGEIRWCQGYSEPNAGSDLASLQTRAEDRGDHYVVNGQKIWTSYADQADWIFCLVRTDPSASKHNGISFVLFDMASPGVSTKPIRLISGKSPFCETFFDDVRVEKRNRVGAENAGWEVAKYLLQHEREMISGSGSGEGDRRPLGQVIAGMVGLDEQGRLADPLLRAKVAEFEVDEAAFRLLLARFTDQVRAGQADGAFPSALKYYGTELNKRRHELMVTAGGTDLLEWDSDRSNQGEAIRAWLRTKANSIEGGTTEVQLGVIAKRILRLPGA